MVLCLNYDENFRKYFDLWDHFRPLAKKKGSNKGAFNNYGRAKGGRGGSEKPYDSLHGGRGD